MADSFASKRLAAGVDTPQIALAPSAAPGASTTSATAPVARIPLPNYSFGTSGSRTIDAALLPRGPPQFKVKQGWKPPIA